MSDINVENKRSRRFTNREYVLFECPRSIRVENKGIDSLTCFRGLCWAEGPRRSRRSQIKIFQNEGIVDVVTRFHGLCWAHGPSINGPSINDVTNRLTCFDSLYWACSDSRRFATISISKLVYSHTLVKTTYIYLVPLKNLLCILHRLRFFFDATGAGAGAEPEAEAEVGVEKLGRC